MISAHYLFIDSSWLVIGLDRSAGILVVLTTEDVIVFYP